MISILNLLILLIERDPLDFRRNFDAKYPPVVNRPAFYSLRHKRAKSLNSNYIAEFNDDTAVPNFDVSGILVINFLLH